jgi:outer membrane protein assembly factor BamB
VDLPRPSPCTRPADSQGIMAIDPETGKARWKHELVQNDLEPGLLATGGGVLFAATAEGTFLALDAATGAPLWISMPEQSLPHRLSATRSTGGNHVAVSSANVLYSFTLLE